MLVDQRTIYKEDTKSANTIWAIQNALCEPLYTSGFMTDYEVIMAIKAIVDKATPPEVNTVDQNTGLRYTEQL